MERISSTALNKWEEEPWNPRAFDLNLLYITNISALTISFVAVIINAAVVYVTVTSQKLFSNLLSTTSSRILLSLWICYIALAVSQIPIRIIVQIKGQWDESVCMAHFLSNCFIVVAVSNLFMLTIDQIISVFWLHRMNPRKVWIGIIVNIVSYAGCAYLHFMHPYRAIYGQAGGCCGTSAWRDWIGLAFVGFFLFTVIFMIVAYTSIFIRLRIALKSSQNRRSINESGISDTMYSTSKPSQKSANPDCTIKRKISLILLLKEKSRENKIKRKMAIRAALAVLNASSLLIPIIVLVINVYVRQDRGEVVIDAVVPSFVLATICLEPLISIATNTQLRKAVVDLLPSPLRRVKMVKSTFTDVPSQLDEISVTVAVGKNPLVSFI